MSKTLIAHGFIKKERRWNLGQLYFCTSHGAYYKTGSRTIAEDNVWRLFTIKSTIQWNSFLNNLLWIFIPMMKWGISESNAAGRLVCILFLLIIHASLYNLCNWKEKSFAADCSLILGMWPIPNASVFLVIYFVWVRCVIWTLFIWYLVLFHLLLS